MKQGEVRYAIRKGVCVLKFIGDVLYTSGSASVISRSLDAFLDRIFQSDEVQNVLIDLSETTHLDSTNLGLVARVAVHLERERGRRLTIVTPNPDITTVMVSMGFAQVALLIQEQRDLELPLELLPQVQPDERADLEVVLRAHKELIALSEENRAVFADAVRLLESELAPSSGPIAIGNQALPPAATKG